MCVFDKEVQFTRCLCDNGWTGTRCETQSSGSGGNGSNVIFNLEEKELLGAIIVLAVLLLVVSCIFWRCYIRLDKKYKQIKIKTLDNQCLVNDGDDIVGKNKSPITVYSDDKSLNSPQSMSSESNDTSQDSLNDKEEEDVLLKK